MSPSRNHSSTPAPLYPLDLFGTVFYLQEEGVVAPRARASLSGAGPDGVWTALAVRFENDKSVHADVWERHPLGEELLCVFSGMINVYLRDEGIEPVVTIGAGDSFVVPCNRWHRLSVLEPGYGVGITVRTATQHEPVSDARAAHGAGVDLETSLDGKTST